MSAKTSITKNNKCQQEAELERQLKTLLPGMENSKTVSQVSHQKCVRIRQCCEQKRRQLSISCYWLVVKIGILNISSAHFFRFYVFTIKARTGTFADGQKWHNGKLVKQWIHMMGFFIDWCDGTCSSLHWKAAEQLDRTDPHSRIPWEVKDDWSGHRYPYPLRLSRRPGNYQT